MTSYAEVSGWADMIAEVVRQRRMPPWHADPKYGHFSNDRSLPEQEKELLSQWAAAGAPEGDPKELPPASRFVGGWRLPNGAGVGDIASVVAHIWDGPAWPGVRKNLELAARHFGAFNEHSLAEALVPCFRQLAQ